MGIGEKLFHFFCCISDIRQLVCDIVAFGILAASKKYAALFRATLNQVSTASFIRTLYPCRKGLDIPAFGIGGTPHKPALFAGPNDHGTAAFFAFFFGRFNFGCFPGKGFCVFAVWIGRTCKKFPMTACLNYHGAATFFTLLVSGFWRGRCTLFV